MAILAAALLTTMAEATGQGPPPIDPSATTHVRGVDQRARVLLDEGRSRSATIRRLCDALEESDVIVLIESGTAEQRLPAQTTFLGASRAARFVRITLTLSVPEQERELLGWLAHELQHAVEIASARQVVSASTLRQFYWKSGLCTREAKRVRSAVMYELSVSDTPRDDDKTDDSLQAW